MRAEVKSSRTATVRQRVPCTSAGRTAAAGRFIAKIEARSLRRKQEWLAEDS